MYCCELVQISLPAFAQAANFSMDSPLTVLTLNKRIITVDGTCGLLAGSAAVIFVVIIDHALPVLIMYPGMFHCVFPIIFFKFSVAIRTRLTSAQENYKQIRNGFDTV